MRAYVYGERERGEEGRGKERERERERERELWRYWKYFKKSDTLWRIYRPIKKNLRPYLTTSAGILQRDKLVSLVKLSVADQRKNYFFRSDSFILSTSYWANRFFYKYESSYSHFNFIYKKMRAFLKFCNICK